MDLLRPVVRRDLRRIARLGASAAAAALLVAGATACEPPPPPDGRDLGLAFVAPAPAVVAEGAAIELTGTLTNHGSAPADQITLAAGFDTGFVLDQIDLGAGASCTAASAQLVTCAIAGELAPGASRSFTVAAVAGTTSGPSNLLMVASSGGTEPVGDPHPNQVTTSTQVRPPAADPVALDMGTGTNHLGTGNLLGPLGVAGHPAEGSYLSVNPYCTDKVNGDRYQAGYSAPNCAGTVNDEYRSNGYLYAIDVPTGRTSPIDVLLWDARYDEAALPGGEAAIDTARRSGDEAFTFTLLAADSTPADPTDNPLSCTTTYSATTPFDRAFLGSERWNRLCQIPADAPSGRYLLRVRNGGAVTNPLADGSNQFGLAAVYESDGADPTAALCAREVRPSCPVVSGAGEASLFVASASTTGRVAIGAPDAAQEGRVLRLELFDPGEGLNGLRLLAPSGPGTWSPVEVTWSSPGMSGSGGTATTVDLTNGRFNGRLLTLEVDLAGWQPATAGPWLVEYSTAAGTVTDRTTWDVSVVDWSAP